MKKNGNEKLKKGNNLCRVVVADIDKLKEYCKISYNKVNILSLMRNDNPQNYNLNKNVSNKAI